MKFKEKYIYWHPSENEEIRVYQADEVDKEIERIEGALKKIEFKSDFNKSNFRNIVNCQTQLLEIYRIVQALKDK